MIDKNAFHALTYGLFVVGSKMQDGRKAGCVANTFQQVASDPVRVSVSLNKLNATTTAVLASGRFTVSVLSQDATMDLIGTFGFRSSLDIEKFNEADHELDAAQMPCLRQMCTASFSVRVDQTVDVGSHLLFIGEVEEACVLNDDQPLTYAYYHEVLRGKTPPKAASYLASDSSDALQTDQGGAHADVRNANASDPAASTATGTNAAQSDDPSSSPAAEKIDQLEAAEPKYAWQCTLCGHIEYVEELPDDFICPICGAGKELFERIQL